MKGILRSLFFSCSLLAFTIPAIAAPLSPEPVYPEIAKRMVRQLDSLHLSQEVFGERLSAIAWTNLVNSLDSDHMLLTQEDLKKFEPQRQSLAEALRMGDLSFGYNLMQLIQARWQERCDFVDQILKQEHPFDFSGDDVYEWKRREAPRPQNREEQKQLWLSSLKNEYLAISLTKEFEAEEAQHGTEKPEKNLTDDGEDMKLPVAEILRKRYKTIRDAFAEMDSETVLQRYLSAVANAYDPHTDYMSPINFEDFNIGMNLTLYGIGATLRMDDGAIRVTEIMPGAPAARDTRSIRLQEGDLIIGVGQENGVIEDIRHKPLTRTIRKIRGPKGTKVVLRVIPATDKTGTQTKLVDLIRDEIKLEEQAVTGKVESLTAKRKLGYVRIPTFYAGMSESALASGTRSMTKDLLHYIQQFNEEHVDGVVIDLRNNGGGSLQEARNMVGLFVHGPAVQVRDTRAVQVLSSSGQVACDKPLVVLVNRASASASEIVASALQDYGRAIIVGDSRTHGKGTVQTVQGLGDTKIYGADRVTVACFYRINGGTTQLRGVIPDIVLPSLYDALDIGEDKLPGALSYSTVPPAYYVKTSDITPFVHTLRERSQKRLANDQAYQDSQDLIALIRKANAEKTVSLNIDKRRAWMRAERALQKSQEKVLTDALKRKKKAVPDDDPVLKEAFHILSDYIDLRGGADVPVKTDGDLGSRLFRIFGYQ